MRLTFSHRRKIAAARIWARETISFLRSDRSDATRCFFAIVVIIALWGVAHFLTGSPPHQSSTTALITS